MTQYIGLRMIKDNWKPIYTHRMVHSTFQQVDGYVPPIWPTTPEKQQTMAHLDFHAEDMEEGVQHALACGATLSEVQLEEGMPVLFDPAGHPFCIAPMPPWLKDG